jgi:hypothetical protein
MRKAIMWISCAGLAACSWQRTQLSQDAQSYLIGLTKDEILRCMGRPMATIPEHATEVWSFEFGNGGGATVYGDGAVIDARCSVKIVMIGDRVSQVIYSNPRGGLLSWGDPCYFALQRCMYGL